MAELKDREGELNAVAASHRKQIHAWEQDRRRMLSMEQRCRHLDGEDADTNREDLQMCTVLYEKDFCFCPEELQKRDEVIRVLTKRVWVVESREKEVQKELSVAREQLGELQEKRQSISQKCEDFEVQFV